MLADPDIRLLTVTGPGGIGKTRLVLKTVSTLATAFPDGIVLASLAPTNDPDRVPMVIAHALALDPRADLTAADALRDAIADRRLLLVLDNLEHLLPAGLFLGGLLGACPSLTILATSRTRLGLSGEHVFILDPLSPEDARTLFLQRSGATNVGRSRNDAATTIDTICTRLDRIPLAIELAAARTATLPVDALLDRLSQPLSLLRHGPRDVPLRHQTMRDTIAWSYALLDDVQKAGFRRLSVFVGGFTLEGAQAVLGDALDALDLIEFLVARSLVVPMAGESSRPRFTMLESIRQFGVETLADSGEAEEIRAAHADSLIALTEEAVRHYGGPHYLAFFGLVRDEMDNVRAAMSWCLDRGDGIRANRLAGAIGQQWQSGEATWLSTVDWRDRMQEGYAWTRRALALRADVPSRYLLASINSMLGIAPMLGISEGMDDLARELLARAREQDDVAAELAARGAFTTLATMRGDAEAARNELRMASVLAPRSPDPDHAAAIVACGRAILELGSGDAPAAESASREALDRARCCGDLYVLMGASAYLMMALHRQDKWRETAHYATENLRYLRALRDVARAYIPAELLADVALRADLPDEAMRLVAYASLIPHYYGTDFYPTREIGERVRGAMLGLVGDEVWEEGLGLSLDDAVGIGERIVLAIGRDEPERNAPRVSSLLSPREEDVLHLLVAGKTNRAIGDELFISERTVERHVSSIMTKLDLATRTALVAWAIRADLDSRDATQAREPGVRSGRS
ncbi:MAG: LuxR C-terminal-related transcriptional regulator [Thermomicrobiales bacterium]